MIGYLITFGGAFLFVLFLIGALLPSRRMRWWSDHKRRRRTVLRWSLMAPAILATLAVIVILLAALAEALNEWFGA